LRPSGLQHDQDDASQDERGDVAGQSESTHATNLPLSRSRASRPLSLPQPGLLRLHPPRRTTWATLGRKGTPGRSSMGGSNRCPSRAAPGRSAPGRPAGSPSDWTRPGAVLRLPRRVFEGSPAMPERVSGGLIGASVGSPTPIRQRPTRPAPQSTTPTTWPESHSDRVLNDVVDRATATPPDPTGLG
jgi:hypothetical protein